MSLDGPTIGSPSAGFSKLRDASISSYASSTALGESGTCTAIWSPSKSALNAEHTNGWICIALPSTSTGSKACIPNLCRVGARLSSTGLFWMTSSNTSHTSGLPNSMMRFALFTLLAC